ncbi:MAG: hypothetical protein MJZ33_11205 [Paludibacteraceae bacterium]|nr:hypothetical protein [Paludibacteraceae bacterium]
MNPFSKSARLKVATAKQPMIRTKARTIMRVGTTSTTLRRLKASGTMKFTTSSKDLMPSLTAITKSRRSMPMN